MAARVLVEQYIDGPEFSVETFGGSVVEVVGKHVGPPPHFVEIGHDVPASVPAGDRAALVGTTMAALSALDLGWGAAHTELRMTAAGPVVIEVNPRLAGGMIPEVLRAARGVDLLDRVVAAAAGLAQPAGTGETATAAIRFVLAREDGIVTRVPDVAAVRAVPGVHHADVMVRAGDRVTVSNSFKDRIGYVITSARDLSTAVRQAESMLGRLQVDIG